MTERKDLSGKRFGALTVLEKADGVQDRYYTWRCLCDCGKEIIVNTKNLNAHRTTHCGCKSKELRNPHMVPKDRTETKFGALTALQMIGKSDRGEFLRECRCECGNSTTVPATMLERGTVKDCGCGRGQKPKHKDLTGKRKGQLTALYPTDKRDSKGGVIWICRCDCGSEIEMSESDFVFGGSVSCGCKRRQNWEEGILSDCLTFVDGTCVEVLSKRKKRSDNSSGFRGVYKYSDTVYRVGIGLQGKQYYLGRYKTFEEAVAVRLNVEKCLHEGFISCWNLWREKAEKDAHWAENNPFFFKVEKNRRAFRITSAVTEETEFEF